MAVVVVATSAAAPALAAALISTTAFIIDPPARVIITDQVEVSAAAPMSITPFSRPGGDHNSPGGGGDHRPGGGGDHDRPGDGGDHNRPGGGQGGDGNDYYFGWDNPAYGYGVATGLAIGTYVYSVASKLRVSGV